MIWFPINENRRIFFSVYRHLLSQSRKKRSKSHWIIIYNVTFKCWFSQKVEEYKFEGIYKNKYCLKVFLNYCALKFTYRLVMRTRLRHYIVMHARLSSSLSSFQAFWVQSSYCRLNIEKISAFLKPDRSTVGETRKYQTRSAFFDSLSGGQR